jgi:hypothetical protein
MNRFFDVNTFTGWYGHSLFAVLAALALRFWPERTLILDASFQSYLFVTGGHPVVMVERFGAASVHLLPVAAVWAGAGLATVLALYSVSIVLFHWALFALSYHGLRDLRAALAIPTFNILLAGDSFYWMQNELLQAISLLFLALAWWSRRGDLANFRWWDYPLSIFLAVTLAYYHPLIIFPLGFAWLFFYMTPARPFSRRLLMVGAGVFGAAFLSKYIFRQPNFYDRGMTGQFVREFSFSFDRLIHSQAMHDFLVHRTTTFWLLGPMLLLVLGFYLGRRHWWKAALVAGSTAFYILLIMQRFRDDDRWYIAESHYQAVAVFLLLPLFWDIWPWIRPRSVALGALVFIALIRLLGIYRMNRPYTDRLEYVKSLIEETKVQPGRKFVIAEDQLQRRLLGMTWGLPFETWQITALESPDSVRVIGVAEDPVQAAASWPADSMVTFLMFPRQAFRDMPERYYRMRDTTGYRVTE